jgi:biopolymer transport protein ExbD
MRLAKAKNRKTPPKTSHITTRPLNLWQDSPSSQEEARINILPLMDVIFCILAFFILGAVELSRQQAISLDLPKAATGTPQMREMLVVSLDDFGQLYVEQQLVTPEQLQSTIQNYHQYNPNGLMVLHAARNSTYNEVIEVLDMLRSVGGERVALATLPGDSNDSNLQNSSNAYTNYNSLPLTGTEPGSFSRDGNQGASYPRSNPSAPLLPGVPTAPDTTSQTTNN